MSVLFFWTGEKYSDDMQKLGKTYKLIQNSELIIALKAGEHMWAFTRRIDDKTYVLAADLIVTQTQNVPPGSPDYEYGQYRALANRQTSRYFDISRGRNAEPLIRSLSITARAKILGHSFQGEKAVKQIESGDQQKLTAFATNLPTK